MKFHFDDVLAEAAADVNSNLPAEPDAGADADAETGPQPDQGLGSEPASPGGPAEPVVDGPPSPESASPSGSADGAQPDTAVGTSVSEVDVSDVGAPDVEDQPLVIDESVWVTAASSGRPWSDLGAQDGLLTFRGNPTRSFYGAGPVPSDPEIRWRFEVGCSNSPVAAEPKMWCGSGWTGQPAVFRLPTTGEWTVAVGAYNRSVNFFDPETGDQTLVPYRTGDIIKGSVTVDPDGYPLLYTGSRDNLFHVVALDREAPVALWQLSSDSNEPTLWNNDWDGSAMVVDDHLFVGGENGRFYIVRLNRGYDALGRVSVDPEVIFSTESWDSDLLTAIGDVEVSVENSVAMSGDVVFFSNSGGLVQGWDVGGLTDGEEPEQVFRYWTGDDTDASIVIDDEGMLYIGSEYQRGNQRSRDLGQIIKLDPSKPDDPFLWGRDARTGLGSGVWATPALYDDLVIVATNEGEVLGLDRATGADRWTLKLEGPLWSSPVVIGDTLVQADCGGRLNAYSMSTSTSRPLRQWSLDLGGCIESTPAVWDGQIYVGTRSGTFFAIGESTE